LWWRASRKGSKPAANTDGKKTAVAPAGKGGDPERRRPDGKGGDQSDGRR
jgi:hypothetical protein